MSSPCGTMGADDQFGALSGRKSRSQVRTSCPSTNASASTVTVSPMAALDGRRPPSTSGRSEETTGRPQSAGRTAEPAPPGCPHETGSLLHWPGEELRGVSPYVRYPLSRRFLTRCASRTNECLTPWPPARTCPASAAPCARRRIRMAHARAQCYRGPPTRPHAREASFRAGDTGEFQVNSATPANHVHSRDGAPGRGRRATGPRRR